MRRIFSVCCFLIMLTVSGFSQDSTVAIIGPGVKYYSVTKSVPWSIKIIEIDLKQGNIKLETALAKDVLGTGFEKTSSLANRRNYSGHLVLGAVNGDYFGISAPTNPYTFLNNSMIDNYEFTNGRYSNRTVFGLLEGNKSVMNILSFAGSVKAKNDSVKVINSFNGERVTDNLVLYNKYIGLNTLTNAFGTEVKLELYGELNVNTPTKFIVKEKVSNVGSMVIGNCYILSGHGTAAAYLNTNISVGDTISLTLGTSPNKGSLYTLIGGGPRLVTNGTRPASFVNVEGFGTDHVNSRHPRTAIGINQDSSKLYMLVVDGRQNNLSLGMTCAELADYMISIGCYQALNLDGGGSTAMVVRGSIVNSPSDGSERSVANAFMVVYEASSGSILQELKITPESIIIDSTQKRKININGRDVYGYPVGLSPNELTWEIIGINGHIDSLGFFVPQGTGTGKIVGKIGLLSDTILVQVQSELIPVWSFSAVQNNLPSWFSSTASTERGFAYGHVNNNDRLYVVNRPNVLILNPATGDQVGTLSTAGISGGTFTLNDVEVSSDGKIFGANLTVSAATSSFKVYKWNSETATADSVISFYGSGRLGDKFTLVGSYADNTAVIYTAIPSSNKVYKWKMNNGVFIQPPTEIILSGVANIGTSPAVYPRGLGDANFFVNGNSIRPMEFTSTGTLVGTAPTSVVDSRSNAMKYFEGDGKKYLIVYQYGFPNENAVVLDITNGLSNAVLMEATPSLGTNSNSTGTSGDIAFRNYKEDIYIYYVLATNNGFAAYQLVDVPVSINEDKNEIPNDFVLGQNYPNPFNPATTIFYRLPAAGKIKLTVHNSLGEEVRVLENTERPAGDYNVSFDGKNLSSGVYFYSIRAEYEGKSVLQVKKMVLMK